MGRQDSAVAFRVLVVVLDIPSGEMGVTFSNDTPAEALQASGHESSVRKKTGHFDLHGHFH